VYQLGYGHLVYRGGTHTRLSHCMGTYATAGRLADALRHNYESRACPPFGAIEADEFLPRRRQPSSDGPAEPTELTLAIENPGLSADHADRWSVLRHLVCWAALLHDVGHVPMGHTLEDEFEGIYEKHDAFSSPRLRHLWIGDAAGVDSDIYATLRRTDLYPDAFRRLGLANGDDIWGAVFLICTWKEKNVAGKRTTFDEILRRCISDSESERDMSVAHRLLEESERLTPWLFSPYMADLVANTISADYLDYLRRDPRNLGLDVLKDDRVVSRFWVGRDHRDQARMALSLVDRRGKRRLDTCTGVVDLVRQRYRFAEIVYYHKAKVSASAMLAKVFQLVGSPDETSAPRLVPRLHEAESVVDELLAAGRDRSKRLRELELDCMPSSLLDIEIGDETLSLLLRRRAWEKLEIALKDGNRDDAIDAMQSISLLDGIARRELYKVAFTMDFKQFEQLSGRRDSPEEDVERSLVELIGSLRGDPSARADVEGTMVRATGGWPANSLLLYVPPRKSQAKGIETGALADGEVVTLGDHVAVKDAVHDLSAHYADLWRLIVLVHPQHADDVVALSNAVDAFVLKVFPDADLGQPGIVDALEKCCWFPYVSTSDRNAARRYERLVDGRPKSEIPWNLLREYDKLVDGRVSDEERALGGALLERMSRVADLASVKARLELFSKPGSLQTKVAEVRDTVLASASREGAGDGDDELRATLTALDLIQREVERR
jgi:HD superfamily phosphohydrolase